MKRNKFRSGIAVIATAALTLSQGTCLTAFADYVPVYDPGVPGGYTYFYEDTHMPSYDDERNHDDKDSREPQPPRNYYYEPDVQTAEPSTKAAAGAKAGELAISAANFPDANFRAYIAEKDKDGSGGLSDEEINKVTSIYAYDKGISSLKGIEYFPKLKTLHCENNNLSSLDVSSNTALTSLDCGNNNLSSLDVSSNTALISLECHNNNISSLDVSSNTALTSLECGNNNLSSLDVSSNTALTSLECENNNISSLDVSQNTALKRLECDSNRLTRLDVSSNTALTSLDCQVNNISSLDVSSNTALTNLYCDLNNLTSLDVSKNTALTNLGCGNNNLTSLDVSSNTALTNLGCGNNNLTSLDVSQNTALTYLNCQVNNISLLDVSSNTALTSLDCSMNSLTSLDVSNCTALTSLWCYDNNLSSLNVSGCTALETLWCEYNSLSSLDVSSCAALKNFRCTNNYIKSKSDIKGLNEAQMSRCDYAVQYYKGFEYDYSNIDLDTAPFPSEDMVLGRVQNLRFTKYVTWKSNYLLFDSDFNYTLPSYNFSVEHCVGVPEKLVTDDGIVFVPDYKKSPTRSEVKWSCSAPKNLFRFDDKKRSNLLNNGFRVFEPGSYEVTYTYTYYIGNRSKDYTKTFTIIAEDKADHVHEYSQHYESYYYGNVHGHGRACSCGEHTDFAPHQYESELSVVPYIDGSNLYFKRCSVCGYYEMVGAENAKTLKDGKTQIMVAGVETGSIPDGAQLKVDDVTAAEKPNLKNVSKVYNISLQSGGVEIQPNGNISVTIPVPEKVNGEKAKVYRKEANGTFTDMKAVYNPRSKTLTFVTNHLSIYAITGGDVLLGDVNGDGKINNTDIILLGRSYMAGTWAQYLDVADMNDDNNINNTDIILLGRLYMSMSAR